MENVPNTKTREMNKSFDLKIRIKQTQEEVAKYLKEKALDKVKSKPETKQALVHKSYF